MLASSETMNSNNTNTQLQTLRRTLHQKAELSGEESQTADILRNWLVPLEPDSIIEGLGGHGLAFVFNGEQPGKTVLLRAELDALPIPETNSFSYRSKDPLVAHKCGHDGHMAMLAGVGAALARNKPKRGSCILLFQPAEETGEGAKRVLADERLRTLAPDYAFGIHNIPGEPLGSVVYCQGQTNLASVGMVVRLRGKTSHAAYPGDGHSPVRAINELLSSIIRISDSEREREESQTVLTVSHLSVGTENLGIAPGEGTLMLVLRAGSDEQLQALSSQLEQAVVDSAERHHLRHDISFEERFRANHSAEQAVAIVKQALKEKNIPHRLAPKPFRWSDDFSEFAHLYPAAFLGLGSGVSCPQLHNPDYDFPDALLEHGVQLLLGIFDKAQRS